MALFMISALPNFRGILKLRAFKLLTLRGGALYGQHKIKTHTQLRVIGEKKHNLLLAAMDSFITTYITI